MIEWRSLDHLLHFCSTFTCVTKLFATVFQFYSDFIMKNVVTNITRF